MSRTKSRKSMESLVIESAHEAAAIAAGEASAARQHTRKSKQRARGFTKLQGQYLAFIHLYTKLHRRSPAEADMQAYFDVTPPSVHRMVSSLAAGGLIARVPGQPRSIKLLVPRDELPELE